MSVASFHTSSTQHWLELAKFEIDEEQWRHGASNEQVLCVTALAGPVQAVMHRAGIYVPCSG
jgi:hypothetical protein